jgi:predicted NBD/HSP70 family sugar kinase
MKHFLCIYYETEKVYGARLDIPEVPGKDSGSLREDLIQAVGATKVDTIIANHKNFADALRFVFAELTKDIGPERFLTIVGHGPFKFESRRLSVSRTARGPAGGANLKAVFVPELIAEENLIAITDAVAVACAGYWSHYTGAHASRSYTVASLIAGIGVGGALVQKYGRSIGRAHHSEFGHTRVHVVQEDRDPINVCRHHDCCLQGMTCWAALGERAKRSGLEGIEDLIADPHHDLWYCQAKYLAQGCQTFMFTAPPFQIVLCGSMFDHAPHLVDMVLEAIRYETGPEFLYPAAKRQEFVVYRSLVQEALIGGLHSGLTASQKAPVIGLHRRVD